MSHAFFRFLRFYNHILHKHKYPVQIATGGLLWFTGDILAQGATHLASLMHRHGSPTNNDGKGEVVATEKMQSPEAPSSNQRISSFVVDWNRTARMALYGVCFSAPTYAFWYTFLDKISHRAFQKAPSGGAGAMLQFPGWLYNRFTRSLFQTFPMNQGTGLPLVSAATLRTWKIIGFKLGADGLIFDPLYLSLFFTATGLMEGQSLKEVKEKMKADLFPTYLIDIFVWAPVQTLNFRFVPVVYQALVVQSCNVIWNAYLSYVQHRTSAASNIKPIEDQ